MFRHRLTLPLLIGSLVATGACYKTDLTPGKGGFLCPDDLCPSGFVCRPIGGQQRCVAEGRDIGVAPPRTDQGPGAEAGRRDGQVRRDRGPRPDVAPTKGCVAGKATQVADDTGRLPFAADHDPRRDAIAAAWVRSGSPTQLMIALRNGGVWERPQKVVTAASSAAVSIDDGRILVAFRGSAGVVQAMAFKLGKPISGSPRTLDTSDRTAGKALAFARDASGRSVAQLVYQGSVRPGLSTITGLKLLEVGRSSGGPGSRPLTVPGPAGATAYGYGPSAVVDRSGVVYAAYYDRRSGVDTAYLAVRKGKVWFPTLPVRLGTMFGPASARRVALAVNISRAALVVPVWDRAAFTGGGGILQYRDATATTWAEVKPGGKRLANPAGGPSLTYGDRGSQGLAFVQYQTGRVAFTARQSSTAAWGATVALSDTNDRGGRRADQVDVFPGKSKVAGETAFDLVYRRENGTTKTAIYHRRITCRF